MLHIFKCIYYPRRILVLWYSVRIGFQFSKCFISFLLIITAYLPCLLKYFFFPYFENVHQKYAWFFFFLPLDILYPPKLRRSIHSCQGKMLGMDRENKGILVGFNSWRVGTFIRACFSNALLHQHPAAFLTALSEEVSERFWPSRAQLLLPIFLSSLPGLSDGGQMPHLMRSTLQ